MLARCLPPSSLLDCQPLHDRGLVVIAVVIPTLVVLLVQALSKAGYHGFTLGLQGRLEPPLLLCGFSRLDYSCLALSLLLPHALPRLKIGRQARIGNQLLGLFTQARNKMTFRQLLLL